MDIFLQALSLTTVAYKRKISVIKLDDKDMCNPVLICEVKRSGRSDAEIKEIVHAFKALCIKVLKIEFSNFKIRYRIVE